MLDDNDLKLIRQIVDQGGRKYTGGNIDRRKYQRLVELGWLNAVSTGVSDVIYTVTEPGRAAASPLNPSNSADRIRGH